MAAQTISIGELKKRAASKAQAASTEAKTITIEELKAQIAGEEPTTPSELAAATGIPGGLRKAAGFAADVAAPAIGAIGGGMAGTPGGPPGIVGGAMLGAAGMEAAHQLAKRGVRKFGADPLTPPPRTSMEAAQDIGLAAATAPADVAGRVVKGMTPAVTAGTAVRGSKTGIPELGAEFDVPLTRAQRKQTFPSSAAETIIRRTLLGTNIFNIFDQAANRRLVAAGQRLGRSISDVKLDSYEAGEVVKQALSAADEMIGRQYNAIVGRIIQRAGNTPVPVTGNLQRTARSLLGEIKKPTKFAEGLRSVEGVQKAISILEDFTNVQKQVPTGLLGPRGEKLTRTVTKTLSFEDAKLLRTLLFKLKESGEMTIGKGSLGQLNHALDEAMQKGLVDAGQGDLAKLFRAASTKFRRSKEILENSTMEAIVKGDRPEKVLDILMRSPETSMKSFTRLVKNAKVRAAVRRSLWDKILSESQREGVQIGNILERNLEKIGQPALRQMFSPAELGKIRRFAKLSDTLSLRASLTKPVSAQPLSLMATMQGTALGLSALTQTPTGYAVAGIGLLTPAVMAKIMTRPGAVEVMTKALRTQSRTRAGAQLAMRIANMAIREGAKMERPERPDFAGQITLNPPPPQ